jgi:FkbM family methyltransferase
VRGREPLARILYRRKWGPARWDDLPLGNLRVDLPAGSSQSWAVALTGRYDHGEVALLGSYLGPRSTAVDIGASLGLYTVQLAGLARERGGRVIAVEPVPGNAAVIRANLQKNGLQDVAGVREVALGARPGTLTMEVEQGGAGNATVSDGIDPEEMAGHRAQGSLGPQVSVPVVTLDSLGIDGPVGVVKMDVEGFEMDVLAGAEEFIARHRPVILAEFNPEWMASRGLTGDEPFRWAEAHGYRVKKVLAGPGRIHQPRDVRTAPAGSPAARGAAELLLVPAGRIPAAGAVTLVGAAVARACGVRDQARVHEQAMRAAGGSAKRVWFEIDPGWGPGRQALELARWVRRYRRQVRRTRPGWVIWHYAAGNHGHRGLPVFAPLWAWALPAGGTPVVLFLHELAYPFGRRGWRGAGQAVAQRAALLPMLMRSRGVMVTTEDRAAWLRSRRWLPRRPVAVIPVCSNLPESPPAPAVRNAVPKVGVFGFRQELSTPQTLVPALGLMKSRGVETELVLAGAPGAGSEQGRSWAAAASAAGIPVQFTGVLGEEALPAALGAIDVFAFVETDGPNTAKSTLAALLALGKAVVAVDGPRSDERMVREGALQLAGGPEEMAAALTRLLSDPDARSSQEGLAAKWYTETISSAAVAARVADFLTSLGEA